MISCADREEVYETLRFSAEVLPRFSTRSYSTTWFSFRVLSPARSTAEMWTKTSFSPTAGVMKQCPLVGLNHLTVPFCIALSPRLKVSPDIKKTRHAFLRATPQA